MGQIATPFRFIVGEPGARLSGPFHEMDLTIAISGFYRWDDGAWLVESSADEVVYRADPEMSSTVAVLRWLTIRLGFVTPSTETAGTAGAERPSTTTVGREE